MRESMSFFAVNDPHLEASVLELQTKAVVPVVPQSFSAN